MKIAIVEDNILLAQTIKTYLMQIPIEIEIVFEAITVEDAYLGFTNNKIDFAILDIEIKGGLVFDALNKLDTIDFGILFLSAYDSYAIKGFQYNAFNYILKPINREQLELEIRRYEKRKHQVGHLEQIVSRLNQLEESLKINTSEKIALPSLTSVSFYKYNEIIWVSADANYCHFNLVNRTRITVSKPLKEYVTLLEKHNFYRIHKSSMVNLNFVKQYTKGDGGSVILENGIELSVSRRKKEGLLEALYQ